MGFSRSIRLITYSEEIINGEPIYVSSNSLPNKAVNFEPAGHAFHNVALKLSGCFEDEETKDETQESVKKKDQEQAHSFDSYSNKGKKKSGSGEKQQDHYALLGLSHLRYLATEEQIRKAYRDAALRHHPDKQASLVLAEDTEEAKQVKKDEIETRFKAIQESYEVLMDPTRRRIYDSTDEFDDEIPTDCSPQEFFKVFGPAFLRNGRWSVQQPAPMLGDDNTPFNDVDKFYDFWYSFKSWREFPHADEFDVEQAESRDHKRWMERQNAKLSEKARKEETTRIRTLVDNAYKKDPRIVRRKEEEKAEKQRKKEAKIMAKKLQEEEAARVALEEKLKKEEDDKKAAEAALQNKKLKEKEKKLLRKERSRFRTLANSVVSNNLLDLTDSHVESICAVFTLEQLKALNDKIELSNDGLEKAKLIRECDVKQETLKENGGSETKPIALASNSYQKKEKIWSKEEIELLRKAIVKYPKGTSRRWEVVSEFIGTGRSVEEILKATKTVLLQKPDSNKAFDSFLEKRKAAPVIASPLSTRDDEVSVTKPVTQQTSNVTDSVPVNVNVTVNEVSSSSDQDVWSAVQERALVQALKTFPKETSQRWERVATAVPGKTVNQCKKKFTLLKESFRNKKTGV